VARRRYCSKGSMALRVVRPIFTVVDGSCPNRSLPLIPGHRDRRNVLAAGSAVDRPIRRWVGIPWWVALRVLSNIVGCWPASLHANARASPAISARRYAERALAAQRYAFAIPASNRTRGGWRRRCYAPRLIGFLKSHDAQMAGEAKRLGIYGFGSGGAIVAKVDARPRARDLRLRPAPATTPRSVSPASRPRVDRRLRRDAAELEAALIFAKVGDDSSRRAGQTAKGGVVCGGIHRSGHPGLSLTAAVGERDRPLGRNLTRRDAEGVFSRLAPRAGAQESDRVFSPRPRPMRRLARCEAARCGRAVIVPRAPSPCEPAAHIAPEWIHRRRVRLSSIVDYIKG